MMRILDEVQGAQTVAISAHIRPDGDAVGSTMGMAMFLRRALPECRVDVFLGHMDAAIERNIAGAETVNHDYKTDVENYDVFICCDCEPDRTGEAAPIAHRARKVVNIDHHLSNDGTHADVTYIEPTASSACELVYNSLDPDGIGAPYMCEEVARNLYIGMMTDTGLFKFSNTGRRTMEIVGRLLEYGFDFSTIVREIYEERTYTQQRLMARAIMDSVLTLDGRCIYTVLPRQTMNEYNAEDIDTNGIVSQLLNTTGCECSIFMYEPKTQPGQWKASMRSNGAVDVAATCELYGGGGHARAAGVTAQKGIGCDELLQGLLAEVARQLEAGVSVS